MNRLADWIERLDATLIAWRERPRVFGTSDCCQFVGECIVAMTGIDLRDSFPHYTDQAAANEILLSLGGMQGLLSSVLGDAKHISRAKVGDVVALTGIEGEGCGICLGVHTASVGVSGLVFPLTLDGVAAWSL